MKIRPAVKSDVPALGKLGAVMVRTHYDFDPLRFIPESPGTETGYGRFLGSQVGKQDVVLLVADLDDQVVGYVYAGLEDYDYMALRGPAGALYDIVVDPAHRQSGVGRALLDAVLTELKKLGAPRVLLSTAEQNVAAQTLFAHAGFRRTMIEMTRELDD